MEESRPYQRRRRDTGIYRRTCLVMIVFCLGILVPGALRLYSLMVNQYDVYSVLARRNQSRTTNVTAARGTITDRNGVVLAQSVSTENVYLDPNELRQAQEDLESISVFLAQLLELDPAGVLQKAKDRSYRYQLLKRDISMETGEKIRTYMLDNDIQGIHLEPSTHRVYPQNTLAAQVIGFTNASQDGAEGVEAAYDSLLSGTAGKVITTKGNNEMDMPYSYENYLDSHPGADVELTLDTTVQAILERNLQQAIARNDVQNGAFGLVMDVDTGEILAMSTLGSYDPNAYLEISDPAVSRELERKRAQYLLIPEDSPARQELYEIWKDEVTKARLKQWRNRCLSDGYEPGSTFKVLTLSSALDCGAVTLDDHFFCAGAEQIPGRSQRLHCWRSAGHGSQTTAQALQNSCNLAFAHIGLKIGGERFYDYVKAFGVLEKTGIDLQGESRGVFFDRSLIVNTEKYGTASLTSASFGQTFKLTPLQLVRAIAAVVNGGQLLEPYIVSKVTDENGKVLLQQEKTVLRQVISQETSDTMCQLLASVVAQGTAKNANVVGYSIGGKTGTSEKIDVFDENGQRVLDKIVSFVGIAPMEDPRYIVLVALDTPSRSTGLYISGGVMAAPVAGSVLAEILPYLGVEQAAQEPVNMPDLTGLTRKEIEKLLKSSGLEAMHLGTEEAVTGQIPLPGRQIQPGTQVIVYWGRQPQSSCTVPNFIGKNLAQANEDACNAGLLMEIQGNGDPTAPVLVIAQSIPPGTEVSAGTVITLQFADPSPSD